MLNVSRWSDGDKENRPRTRLEMTNPASAINTHRILTSNERNLFNGNNITNNNPQPKEYRLSNPKREAVSALSSLLLAARRIPRISLVCHGIGQTAGRLQSLRLARPRRR